MCEKLATCPFYNNKIVIETGIDTILKKKYCEGNKEKCARYLIFQKLGPEFVPNNLFPHMIDQAERLIAEKTEEN